MTGVVLLALRLNGWAADTTLVFSTNWGGAANWGWSYALKITNAMAANASSDTLVVLRKDGIVDGYTTPIPPYLSGVTAISIVYGAVMALSSNGTVTAFGGDANQTNVPAGLSNVVAVAEGGSDCLALRNNGTVAIWGDSSNLPAGLSNVVAISADYGYGILALRANGTVVEWSSFSPPASLTNVIAISCCSSGNLALLANGTVIGWNGSSVATNPLPASATNTVAISGGLDWLLALQADGSVVAAGQSSPPSFSQSPTNVFAIFCSGMNFPDAVVIEGNGAPVITVQPGSQTVAATGLMYLHARAVGVQPISCQWQLNGTNLAGCTNWDLITNVFDFNAGMYQAIVSNRVGSAVSMAATITVQPPIYVPVRLTAPVLQANGSYTMKATAPNGAGKALTSLAPLSLQASDDLVNWISLTNGWSLTSGALNFMDPGAASSPARFYRLLKE